jgi:3-oxoacyl-[acyl-carrier protein] reductase
MEKLKGKIALVTGASQGIGREIALGLAREGTDVAVTARSAAELDSLHAEIQAMGRRATRIVADLERRESVDLILNQTIQELGSVDILVNNAAIGSSADPRPAIAFDDDFWDRMLFINLTIPYLFCKKALPAMIQRHWGRVINIASIASRRGTMHGCSYSASKHGLLGLTRTLALETARDGVTVNAVLPGPTRTKMNNTRIAYDAKRLGKRIEEMESSATPMGRRLDPAEVASLAVYLALPEAAGITGQGYNIDGGLIMA